MKTLLIVAAGFAWAAGPAWAQSAPQVNLAPPAASADAAPSVDKTGFTLFNPTPESALRSFSTDRPDKSNSPFTVDAGHFQYETDLLNATYSRNAGVTTRIVQFADPVLKLGLTNATDLELGFTGVQHVTVSGPGLGGKGSSVWGAGDLVPRLKWNLWGNDGGTTAFAVIPYVKIPTASPDIGNNLIEGGVAFTLGINLPDDFTVIVMTEFDALKNGSNSGRHGNFLNLVNISHTIVGNLSGTLEFAADLANDRSTPSSYTLDPALSYALTPALQLDAAAYIGLTPSSPTLTLYTGISQRF